LRPVVGAALALVPGTDYLLATKSTGIAILATFLADAIANAGLPIWAGIGSPGYSVVSADFAAAGSAATRTRGAGVGAAVAVDASLVASTLPVLLPVASDAAQDQRGTTTTQRAFGAGPRARVRATTAAGRRLVAPNQEQDGSSSDSGHI
jgi:hypothetical protein